MTLLDALLTFAAVVGAFLLILLAVVRGPRRWVLWLVATAYAAFWINVAIWPLGHWDLASGAQGGLFALVVSGGYVLYDWYGVWWLQQGVRAHEVRRRAHYRDYPFNQWKPSDVDEPIDR